MRCEMKIERCVLTGIIATALVAGSGISASIPSATGVPTPMVITVRPVHGGYLKESLNPRDLTVLQGKSRVPIVAMQRLAGDSAGMQLFVLLDDSTRSASL